MSSHSSITAVEGNLFFQLVSDLQEKTSIILTTNKGFEEWTEFLGDAALASRRSATEPKKYKVFAILVPTLLHGLYDYAAFTNHPVVFVLSFIIIVTVAIVLLNRRSKNDVVVKYRRNECPDCHTKIVGKYCIQCGKKLY